jgi:hypothetical protein
VAGTGTITARGLIGVTSGQDGAGGGGAGGRIAVIAATGTLDNLTTDASGGRGGYTNLNTVGSGGVAPGTQPTCMEGSSHGPGGGGAGGAIFLSDAPTAPATMSVLGALNGLTNVVDNEHNVAGIAYGATAGGNGITNTAVTQLVGVQPCTVATRASVCGLRVDPSGTIEFATSSQRRTLGFNIYATADGTGRHDRTLLTERPVLSPVPSSATPILYRADTAPIETPYVVIEEIEVSGLRRSIGPFPVDDARLRLGYERIERWAAEHDGRATRSGARLLSSRRRTPSGGGAPVRRARFARSPGEGVKIEVSAAGPVQVPLSDLVPAGLPPVFLTRPEGLRLTNLGRPVPFRVTMDLGGARVLEFAAERLSTDYSGRNPYVVSWGRGAPPVPSAPLTVSGFPRHPGFVRIEENVFNAVFVAEGADPWIWDPVLSGVPAGPYPFDLPGLRRSAANVRVRVGLIGGSDHEHTVDAFINGQPAGRLTFRGKAAAMLQGTIPAAALRATGNELTLSYTAADSTDEDPGYLFLDVLDLGLSLARPTDTVSIDEISAYDSTLPAGPGANYLIVTHAAFAEQARRIAALKEADGYRTWVVDVENAYDRFTGGVTDPAAVQVLIRRAVRAGAKYVLLVGDDTFDPRDFSGTGETSYIPSLMGWDGEYGRVPSENQYADINGDGAPDVAIGRLPVQTAEQADVLVDKIERQAEVLREAGARHLFVVDNQTVLDPSFATEASRVAGLLGAGADVSWADVSQGIDQARTALFDGLASGPLATHYFGHGSEDFWADESLITADEVASLAPDGHETLLFAWTCVSQNYLFGSGPSFSEAMLLAPRAGALAAVGPTGITNARLQAALFERLYPQVMAGVPLGEALRRAKTEALRANPASRPVIEGWSLLGDPALTVPVGAPAQ